jgi:hypothetical protein
VRVAIPQLPQTTDAPDNDTFRDVMDVAGVVIPLAIVVLVLAVSWPGMRRWVRHRLRRWRRRRHHDAHPEPKRLP